MEPLVEGVTCIKSSVNIIIFIICSINILILVETGSSLVAVFTV